MLLPCFCPFLQCEAMGVQMEWGQKVTRTDKATPETKGKECHLVSCGEAQFCNIISILIKESDILAILRQK